ncbi:MAG: Asp-tRNA(Asn)/Glu-tRNA(Gln) amidotransferase subunit GatA [Planctomycetaceae bacterium]
MSDVSATGLLDALEAGDISSVSLVQQALDRIGKIDGDLGAFTWLDGERALEQAGEIDRRRAAGQPVGRLAGLPVGLKDNICVQGWPTTCGSRMLEGFRAPYSAHVVQRLLAEDAVLIGRNNMDEFAMGSTTESSIFGPAKNPWNTSCTPGGSSGGSAAAVASREVLLSLGSDTGGSIRQPAAFCGIVGVKPTYGRVSRYGLIAFASSLDQIGPFATDVSSAALMLEAISGHDPRDSTSINCPVPSYTQELHEPLKGLRIGLAEEHFAKGLADDVRQAVEQAVAIYRQLGAEVVSVTLPHAQYAVAVYYIVAASEASSNLSRYDGIHYGHRATGKHDLTGLYQASRGEGFGPEVKRRIMLGTYALSSGYYDAYYNKALRVRRLIQSDFDAAFQKCDVIAGPVTPNTAFRTGELASDPLALYLQDIYTLSANLAGLPGISIPCGLSPAGLPIGLQLMAPPFAESRMFRAARMYEEQTDWHTRTPTLTH